MARTATRNTDRVLDVTLFPTDAARRGAESLRPIGVGVQGLSDVFRMLGLSYDTEDARILNKVIFETIYHAALEASCELAEEYGPYHYYEGSPASNGVLQLDFWKATPVSDLDFHGLRERIKQHGLRNSVLTAQMPTATSAQINGHSSSVDPVVRYGQ